MNLPRLFTAFGGNDAQSRKLLANQGVIAFGVELGIGQHAAEGSEGMDLRDQSGQAGAIVPRSLTCPPGQNELSLQVDDGARPVNHDAKAVAVACGGTCGAQRRCSLRLGPVVFTTNSPGFRMRPHASDLLASLKGGC